MAEVIENLDYTEKKTNTEQQSAIADMYEKFSLNVDGIFKGTRKEEEKKECELKTDIETYRKVFLIMDTMVLEGGSSLYIDMFFNEKMTDAEKDKRAHKCLAFFEDKRKEICFLATGKKDFTPEQEVALCGAIFRIGVCVPALLSFDGINIQK